MVGYLIHVQITAESSEIRKSQKEEIYSATNIIKNIMISTKRTLKIEKPKNSATTGLPKCRKTYGDGGPIVTEAQKKSYTTSVMSSECQVVQRIKWKNRNLIRNREETKNNRRRN